MKLFNVLDYGIESNSETVQTAQLQRVIDAVAANKGKVYFPAGKYRSATLQLFSNMTLELETGAEIIASRNYADYRGNGRFNCELGEVVSLLYAIDADNLTICGGGTIDCQGDAFAYMDCPRPILHKKMDVSEMTKEQTADAVVEYTDPRPNQLLYFEHCKNLKIRDVTVKDAPCWTIVLNKCERSKFHDFVICNDQRLCNSDGMHICCCRDIEIYNTTFTCGDDCIAITGTLDWDSFSDGIYIHDCTLSSHSAAARFGYHLSKIRNVKLCNVRIKNCNRALLLNSQKNAVLENVEIDNVVLETRIPGGAWWGNGEAASIRNEGGIMNNISIANISGVVENGLFLCGDLIGVSIENVDLLVKYGKNRPVFDKGVDFQPSFMQAKENDNEVYSIYKRNVTGVEMKNMSIKKAENESFLLTEKEVFSRV